MNDLALELGMSIETLGRMTEREFVGWQAYAAKRLLPTRRMELYLAQIAAVVARSMGGSTGTVVDFLLQPVDASAPDEDEVEELRRAVGFNPRNLKDSDGGEPG